MRILGTCLLSLALAGCSATPPAGVASVPSACPVVAAHPGVLYAGPYYGVENLVPASAYATDMQCAEAVRARIAPQGYLTVFGSSRLGEGEAVYVLVRQFAAAWTRRHGGQYPVMSGAGPGLMLAANQGAWEAGGPSIGYTTYYDRPDSGGSPDKPMGGDPAKALNAHVTQGVVFSSVVTREAAMILHSAAMVIAPGGTGTEWETYQAIEVIKSRQLRPVPVYLLGDRATHWKSLTDRLEDMARRHVIRAEEVAFVRFAATPDELVRALEKDLGLP